MEKVKISMGKKNIFVLPKRHYKQRRGEKAKVQIRVNEADRDFTSLCWFCVCFWRRKFWNSNFLSFVQLVKRQLLVFLCTSDGDIITWMVLCLVPSWVTLLKRKRLLHFPSSQLAVKAWLRGVFRPRNENTPGSTAETLTFTWHFFFPHIVFWSMALY